MFRFPAVLSLFLVAAATACLGSKNNCCQSLASLDASYPNSSAYEASLLSYWAQGEQLIEPSCILQPSTAKDVSRAVELLVTGSCQFAVRSGGHGSVTGTANIQGGVTIDLSLMNATVLSDDKTEVSIGGGQRLGNVYTYLADYGLAMGGARDSGIGIGGSTLGGGIGFLGPREGFAADSVIEYEVVLANGSIVTANKDVNSDLWKALKGGGGNFGIVTNFVFSTFSQGEIWAGDVEFYGTAVGDTAQAMYNFISNPEYDPEAAVLVTYHYSASTGTVPVVVTEYTYGQPVSNASVFGELFAIPGQLGNSTVITTLSDFSVQAESTSPDGYQEITFSMSFTNSVDMLVEVWDIFNTSLSSIQNIEGVSWSLTLEPIVSTMRANGAAKGGDVLDIELPSEGLILTICSATFSLASDYEFMSMKTDELLDELISAAKKNNVYNRFIDMNHAKGSQNPIAGYGSASWKFLNATAKIYDPEGIFQILKPGGFKL